jgi:hypothetical protein
VKVREAERITGYEVRPAVPPGGRGFAFGAWDGEALVAETAGPTENVALHLLVEKVYRIHSALVRKRQGYRCAICGLRKPLTIDHDILRARGRDDRLSNLIGKCVACHDEKHGR